MTAQRFQGKVAVVTGGNSGIGLGVAKAYAREGAQVAITGRNAKTLEAAAKEIADGTLTIQSDAGKVAEIEAAMKRIKERFGRIASLLGVVVPYPTMVVCAPSDLSSVPGAANLAGVIPAGACARKTSPTSATPGSSGATRMSSVGSHCGGGGQCGIEG
jgi:NAD(P)-dependent dehydrogenase (short-subunit alcohol dehydrogenase family)